ncbi:MAG TPA: DUF1800 domain-containing protein [Pyrinomonadaceae bacterium]|nr:DUF1800 domain-containing protein [Pyrinomonadaceae bacterium]
MRVSTSHINRSRHAAARALSSLLTAFVLLAGALPVASAQSMQKGAAGQKAQRLAEEQRVVHVLNRLGFGPQLGDVERVRRMGVGAYVEEQLRPERIDDSRAEARLRDLPTLRMKTAELFAKYPQPGQLIRQLQRDGRLPADLAELYENRRAPEAGAAGQAATQGGTATPRQPASNSDAMPARQPDGQPAPDEMRREYRQALQEFYREKGLQLPQRVTAELQASRVLRAVYSERQLNEVMVDFWTNHFNVFAGKGAGRWLLVAYDRDTIRPHAFGKFKDLLAATAQSPAMLFYLDNFQSVSPNPGQNRRPQQRMRRGINENYARELMELHTLGVEGGYTQRDVQEVARAFTGWTIFDPRGIGSISGLTNPERAGTFNFNPRLHDDGEKTVLGHKIPAGGGMGDGLMVLDILAKHPSTAKFIATKLARRFVTDNPPAALVERVAAAFTRSDGDIRETLRALFASPEFNSAEAYRAKIKSPFELAVSAVRALGGETNGIGLHQWIARMGEPLYMHQAPTGYPDTADRWVNTGALLERINFALALVANRVPGTRVNVARFNEAGADRPRLIDHFAAAILQGDLSPRTKASLLKQLDEAATTAPRPAAGPATSQPARQRDEAVNEDGPAMMRPQGQRGARRAQLASNNAPVSEAARIAALILGSPEFQRQ